ncbi:hypothetical protein GRI43_08130 [Altererythrobacter luteolus]|uniref:Uncharacterized protein n=1 Tax=Pontixanthobacter luteolus TaxID=295089 RepID=A0A6I4UZL4_9SPHN|nr:hypothetical protein [Pontixanthobacter luteolus]MXP47357.1 hypothetical protein [Pontixanthobacter luteolus]
MTKAIWTAVGLALAATTFSAPVHAGPFDKLKSKVKKIEKKAKEVEQTAAQAEDIVETVSGKKRRGSSRRAGVGRSADGSYCNANLGSNSNSPCSARAPDHVGGAGPVPAKFTGQLNCANLGIGNAFVGRDGKYTFSKGISTEERSGLIERRDVQATNGCLYSGLAVGDVLYVEVDKAKYDKHAYSIQCVSYDGSEQLDNVNGPRINNYKGKDVMLHTGHSLGYEPTATGSNSQRSGAYDALLNKRGRTMLTFNFGALHTDKSGTDFFCQWFNDKTGKSALAVAYRRGPQG